MRRYTGLLRYSHDNSGREVPYVKVELAAPFSPGRFAVVVQDATAHTRRVLANRRFNFQARDPPRYSPRGVNGVVIGAIDSLGRRICGAQESPGRRGDYMSM